MKKEKRYIGSTNKDIICRINCHKSDIRNIDNDRKNKNGEIKNKLNEKEKIMYRKIKNEIGIKNIEFIVMNKIKCEDEYELHEIENQYIKFYEPLLNSIFSIPISFFIFLYIIFSFSLTIFFISLFLFFLSLSIFLISDLCLFILHIIS